MITYKDIKPSEIGTIKVLWNKNKAYHEDIDEQFGDQYSNLVFEKRMNDMLNGPEKVKITIAQEKDQAVAYCISTITNNSGELASLHVLDNYRGKGIGKKLTEIHLEWLKKNQCKEIGLYVAAANQNTIKFYKELGLETSLVYMQLKE